MDVISILAMAAVIASPVPEKWIDDIEQVESAGNACAVGDSGKALGSFQWWSTAWADCSKVRKEQGLPVYTYAPGAKSKTRSREYARTWLNHLRQRLSQDIGREANIAEVWLAYNLGYEGFRKYGFRPGEVPGIKCHKAFALWKRNP